MTNQSNSTQDTEDVVARLWQLRRRALSYATDKPAVNFLLSDLAEGLKVAAERINRDQSLSDRIDVLEGALKPFADCVDQIAADEDDEEWARFRLLIKDYRRAAAAFKRPHFERCPTCGGEFDEGEWNASSECPECETPIARVALHQEGIAPK